MPFLNGIMALRPALASTLEIFIKRSNRVVSTSGGLFAFPLNKGAVIVKLKNIPVTINLFYPVNKYNKIM